MKCVLCWIWVIPAVLSEDIFVFGEKCIGAGRPGPVAFARFGWTTLHLKDVMALFCLLCPKALYSVASKCTGREAALRVVSTALSHALSDRCSAHVPCICLKMLWTRTKYAVCLTGWASWNPRSESWWGTWRRMSLSHSLMWIHSHSRDQKRELTSEFQMLLSFLLLNFNKGLKPT